MVFITLIRVTAMENNRKGFSLIELLVVIALMAIVGVGVGIFFTPIVKTYADANINSELQNIAEVMSARFSEKFRFQVDKLELTDAKPTSGYYVFGNPSFDTVTTYTILDITTAGAKTELFDDVLGDNHYSDIKFSYNSEANHLLVKLLIAKDEKKAKTQLFEYDFTIKLLNKPTVICDYTPCSVDKQYTHLVYKKST